MVVLVRDGNALKGSFKRCDLHGGAISLRHGNMRNHLTKEQLKRVFTLETDRMYRNLNKRALLPDHPCQQAPPRSSRHAKPHVDLMDLCDQRLAQPLQRVRNTKYAATYFAPNTHAS